MSIYDPLGLRKTSGLDFNTMIKNQAAEKEAAAGLAAQATKGMGNDTTKTSWLDDWTKLNDKGVSKLGDMANTAGRVWDMATSGYGMYLANQKGKMEKDAYNKQNALLAKEEARRDAFAKNASGI